MFTSKKALFLYAVSPVHMGAGTAIGLIDNPIQREKHTDYPTMAGSGLKGAIRHRFWAESPEQRDKLSRYFGPDTDTSSQAGGGSYAGAVSVSDAQLVVLPVRSGKAGFVYVTSPLALARAQRLLVAAGNNPDWSIPPIPQNACGLINPDLVSGKKIQIDVYEFEAKKDDQLKGIAEWLAEYAFPKGQGCEFFRDKLKSDLVLLSDSEFSYFAKNAMVIEPHVRIDHETGVALDGGLYYTENLPPESLLISVIMASDERTPRSADERSSAETIISEVTNGANGFGGLHGKLVQVGGDNSTGRGQMIVNVVEA